MSVLCMIAVLSKRLRPYAFEVLRLLLLRKHADRIAPYISHEALFGATASQAEVLDTELRLTGSGSLLQDRGASSSS